MRELKVMEVVADGAPGGGTTVVLGLCEDLIAQGFKVSLCTQRGSYASRAASERGIRVYEADFFSSRFDPRIGQMIRKSIGEFDPDIVHAHGARAGSQFCLPTFGNMEIPLLYTVHGYHFPSKPRPVRDLAIWVEKRISYRSRHTVFVSQSDASVAFRNGIVDSSPEKWSVIYNGISAKELTAVKPLERQYDLVFAGRMHPQKNPLFMIEIMNVLRGKGMTLLMIGGGELERSLRQRCLAAQLEDQVTITGALSRDDALRGMRSAKVLVFPSLWEGFPVVPLEAHFYGIPIVASQISGTDEIVVDGESGLMQPDFNAEKYAHAIEMLLLDDKRRRLMGEAGRSRVLSRFSRERATELHIQLYDRAIRDRSRASGDHSK